MDVTVKARLGVGRQTARLIVDDTTNNWAAFAPNATPLAGTAHGDGPLTGGAGRWSSGEWVFEITTCGGCLRDAERAGSTAQLLERLR